ncbi:MAG TPA: hypothetical protein VHE78_16420, partial [Gemmatimonadaceae bacterium]|nr:hypothetical protein [Gemmatimonadaceae bacterium]
VAPTTFVTGIDGKARAGWTLKGTSGANSLMASGRGIGGEDFNGPREGIDPFQPIQPISDPSPSSRSPVTLQTGSQTFRATSFSFTDGFEVESGWTATGFWNRSTLRNGANPIMNAAYPTYVDLAPGDASGGAMPSPFAGSYVFWYGNPAAGNYLGPQQANDAPKSGGRGTASNTGVLTSPSIVFPTATGMSLVLRFNTWWEIESVNPSLFDRMELSVQDVSTSAITSLGMLNPATDPTVARPPSAPFTSGGFNTPPGWVEVVKDLSAFRGKTIRLIFTFNTVDLLYNGFRGWLLDNVRITPDAPPTSSLSLQQSTPAFGLSAQQATAPTGTLQPVLPLRPRP